MRRDPIHLAEPPHSELEVARARAAAKRRALVEAGLTGHDLVVHCRGCERFLASWKDATLAAHLRREALLECPGCGHRHELRPNLSKSRLYLRSGPRGQPLVTVERADIQRDGRPIWDAEREPAVGED